MKAMILAAGLGTRLQPLTLKTPKPLLPVANRPVIDRSLEYLKHFGVTHVIVNAHHLHEMVISYFGDGSQSDPKVQVRVEPVILGTGGGIKNSEDFFDETPFLVMNGDILTDIDLASAMEAHQKEGNLVTMILHDHPPFNQVSMDPQGCITQDLFSNRSGRPCLHRHPYHGKRGPVPYPARPIFLHPGLLPKAHG